MRPFLFPVTSLKGKGEDFQPLFLRHARGSLFELETQVQIALRLSYIDVGASDALLSKTAEVGRVLNGLIASV